MQRHGARNVLASLLVASLMLVGCDVTKDVDLDTESVTYELGRVWHNSGWSSVPQWESSAWRPSTRPATDDPSDWGISGRWHGDTLLQSVRSSKGSLTLNPNGTFQARMYLQYGGFYHPTERWVMIDDTFDVHGTYARHGTFLDIRSSDGAWHSFAELSDRTLMIIQGRPLDLGERVEFRGPRTTANVESTTLSDTYRLVEFGGQPVPVSITFNSISGTWRFCEGLLRFAGNTYISSLTYGRTCDSAHVETAEGSYLLQGPIIRLDKSGTTQAWARLDGETLELPPGGIGPMPTVERTFVRDR